MKVSGRLARGVLVVVCSLMVGCATVEGNPTSAGPVAPSQQPTLSSQASLYGPLMDAYYGGMDPVMVSRVVGRKHDEKIQQCMKAAGYGYQLEAVSDQDVADALIAEAYGGTFLAAEGRRKDVGYGVTAAAVGKAAYHEADAEALTPAEQRQRDDCAVSTREEAWPPELDELARLSKSVTKDIDKDPMRVKAAQAWVTCMADRGYVAPDFAAPPQQLEVKFRALMETAGSDSAIGSPEAMRLHDEELAMAQWDWTCRERTYNEAYMTVRNRVEARFVEDHLETVELLKAKLKQVVSS